MSIRDDNLKSMQDILVVLGETLDVIKAEVIKCRERVKHLKAGLEVENQIGPTHTTINPLKAPEIIGADRDGDGGHSFHKDESNGQG